MSVERVLEDLVEAKSAPGAVCAFGTATTVKFANRGRLTFDEGSHAVDDRTLFDLASLTKPIAVASLCMVLEDRSEFDRSETIEKYLPEVKTKDVTYAHLLRHDSGAVAYCNLEGSGLDGEKALGALLELNDPNPMNGPPVYSCVGYIRLATALSRRTGKPLDELFETLVNGPLGTGFRFNPGVGGGGVAPTVAWEPWRERCLARLGRRPPSPWVTGEPHDPLAWLLGGVSGNAGLFGSARDIAAFSQAIMRGKAPFSPAVWARYTDPKDAAADRVCGWHLRSEVGSSAGPSWGKHSVGHTGYTGTMLWIDHEKGVFAALLTSAVHPGGDPTPLRSFRPLFAEAAWQQSAQGS